MVWATALMLGWTKVLPAESCGNWSSLWGLGASILSKGTRGGWGRPRPFREKIGGIRAC